MRNDTPDAERLLDHAAEIDAAVKFGQFLMTHPCLDDTTLHALAVECFTGIS